MTTLKTPDWRFKAQRQRKLGKRPDADGANRRYKRQPAGVSPQLGTGVCWRGEQRGNRGINQPVHCL